MVNRRLATNQSDGYSVSTPTTNDEPPELLVDLRRFLGVLGVIALIGFMALLINAHDHALGRVQVAGVIVTENTKAKYLSNTLVQKAQNYKIAIEHPDKMVSKYSTGDAGIAIDESRSAQSAISAKKDGSTWQHLKWWSQKDVPLTLRINQPVLTNFMTTNGSKIIKPYVNAGMTIDNGKVSMSDSSSGQSLRLDGSQKSLIDAVKHLDPAPLRQHLAMVKPAINRADLTDSVNKVDRILKQTYVFNVADTSIKAGQDDIGKWIDIAPDEAKHALKIGVNSGAVEGYIDSISEPYSTPGHAAVNATVDGSATMIIPGLAGSDVVNKAAVASEITKKVMSAQGATVSLNVSHRDQGVVNAQAADKWLLVDLTNKRMYAIEKQNIIRTFLVTAGQPSTPTVTGTYAIYSKLPVQDMHGANVDGSAYFQPNVQWVEYFYKDYAVHGNYWRPSSYFGNINSSHGCVSTINSDAEWIYNWSSIGTPVVVYD